MIVYKFGGTSIGTADRILAVRDLIRRSPEPPVVVVSALAGVTDLLGRLAASPAKGRDGAKEKETRRSGIDRLRDRHLEIANVLLESSGEERRAVALRIERILDSVLERLESRTTAGGPARRMDAIRAAGEDLSVVLVASALRAGDLPALEVDARTIVRTDARFGNAVPDDATTYEQAREQLFPHLAAGRIPVLQGFVGADPSGETTTLGRGGSDFTAAMIGAALGAAEVDIWTDVEGIFTADPRTVPTARVLSEIGYEEAVELAYFGARVVHPAAAKHAVARSLSLRIRSSFLPDAAGTLIRHDRREGGGVAAVAMKPGITLLKVRSRPLFMAYGFLAAVFDVLARHRVPVDLVSTSHTSTAFTLDDGEFGAAGGWAPPGGGGREETDPSPLGGVIAELARFAEVERVHPLATVTLIGAGLLGTPGIASRIFGVLDGIPIHLISHATAVSLSLVVGMDRADEVVRRLHERVVDIQEGR